MYEVSGYDLDEEEKDDDSDEEESKSEIKKKEKMPYMNEFHEAFCEYMLLKAKIKYELFDKALDLIESTKKCIKKFDNLRARIPFDSRSFMTVEDAFILNETIQAIRSLID